MYLKGSDRKIFAGINEFSKQNILEKIKEDSDYFAKRGLRTLCYSYKNLDESIYLAWEKNYLDLKYKSINDKSLNKDLDELIEVIEKETFLLGVSALEDKLQDCVKDDIQSFIEAGINVWMITGDKMDTAESIGHSCKLFDESTEIYKIRESKDTQKVIDRMTEILGNIEKADFELEEVNDRNTPSEHNIIVQNENNSLMHENRIQFMDDKHEENKDKNIGTVISSNYNKIEIGRNNNNLDVNDQSIFKFMINKNYLNNSDSKFEKLSILEGKVKQASISENNNIKEMKFLKNERNNHKDISFEVNQLNINGNNNRDEMNKNNEKKISIPTNEKKLKSYYELCQQKLSEIEENKTTLRLLRTKYLYPTFEKKQKKIKCKCSIIIEGESITKCMEDNECKELFWEIIQKSRSLICCRASPMQKCEVVNFIKNHTNDITLAIGDGGNDVNMIKSSHVGIGLFGKEGYQAAYSSDYAISQFKYLKQLIFITGRFCLKRNSYFIYQYFFKNILYTLPQFWLCFYSCFNGTNLFDEWYYMGFNSFVTVVPVAARAISEEDFDPDFADKNEKEKHILQYLFPNIFKEYRDSIPFNLIKFFTIFTLGIILSIPIYFFPAYIYIFGIRGSDGTTFCYWDISVVVFYTIMVVHFYMVFTDTLLIDYFIIIFYSLQLLIDIGFFVIYNAIDFDVDINGDLYEFLGNGIFWLTLILTCSVVILPFFILRRLEFFFGGFIVDMIKQNKYEQYYIEKFYQKKIDHMIRAKRSVLKFKKLYKNEDEIDYAHDNIADQQMRKIVNEYKNHRMESKKK